MKRTSEQSNCRAHLTE